MAHEITVMVEVDANGDVLPATWNYRGDLHIYRRMFWKRTVKWKLKATYANTTREVPANKLCFALPSNGGRAWGVEVKPPDRLWPGNNWLTAADVTVLIVNLWGSPRPVPVSSSSEPLEFEWEIKPTRIMRGIRRERNEMFYCPQWMRVVNDAGRVFEDDPELRFKSRF